MAHFLIMRFLDTTEGWMDDGDSFDKCKGTAKDCALICVEEIWDALKPNDDVKTVNSFYWEQVKDEIWKA